MVHIVIPSSDSNPLGRRPQDVGVFDYGQEGILNYAGQRV